MNKHQFIILSLSIINIIAIQGCSNTLLVSSTAIIAFKTASDPRSLGTQIDDTNIETRITNALSTKKIFSKENRIINISYQGNILLIGQTTNDKTLKQAKDIIVKIKGVQKIYNEIRYCKPISTKLILIDTWITSKIIMQLLIHPKIKSSKIKVITENKEVFLLGTVTHKESSLATEIASKTQGVKLVTTAFIYSKN